jgi:enoyl-CoA hydratase
MARGKGRIGVPELLVGVPFPLLALEIVRRVATNADDVTLTGRSYTAEEALERCLVDELVEPDQLLDRAVAGAAAMARIPPRSFALTKRGLRRPTLDLLERHGPAFDAEVLEAWTSDEVHAAIAGYVSETLGK